MFGNFRETIAKCRDLYPSVIAIKVWSVHMQVCLSVGGTSRSSR